MQSTAQPAVAPAVHTCALTASQLPCQSAAIWTLHPQPPYSEHHIGFLALATNYILCLFWSFQTPCEKGNGPVENARCQKRVASTKNLRPKLYQLVGTLIRISACTSFEQLGCPFLKSQCSECIDNTIAGCRCRIVSGLYIHAPPIWAGIQEHRYLHHIFSSKNALHSPYRRNHLRYVSYIRIEKGICKSYIRIEKGIP